MDGYDDIIAPPGTKPPEPMPYIFVQFKSDLPEVLGKGIETRFGEVAFEFIPDLLNAVLWRQREGQLLDKLLKSHMLGWCSGGGTGFGRIDIDLNLHDWSRLDEAIQVIIDDLTDREVIGWATIITSVDGVRTVRWPKESTGE